MSTRAENLCRAAEQSKDRGLECVLTGLAIRECGKVLSSRLAERFGTMDRLMAFAGAYVYLKDRHPEIGYRERWAIAEGFVGDTKEPRS